MKGVLIICEGKQDVAYISILLELLGFLEYKRTINEFDQPLRDFFLTQVKSFEYDNNRLRKGPNLPVIYQQPNNHRHFAIVYSIDGIRNKEKAKILIESYRTMIEFGKKVDSKKISLSLCIILDADDTGVEDRVNEMKEDYKDTIANIDKSNHNTVIDENLYKSFGCYILSGNNEKGNLEDVIIEALIRNGDFKNKMEASKKFLEMFPFERKVKKGNELVLDDKRTSSDKKKSVIAIASQFNFSGLDNSQVIKKNKTLKGLLPGHDKSTEIMELFSKLLKASRN